jgi:uncharacterized protein (TIGR02646 family)
MKHFFKSAEPPCLQTYRSSKPSDSWDQMRDDSLNFGKAVYDCIAELISTDQGSLCAYCEIEISRSLNTYRVDHFVSKSLADSQHNWGLDWSNMVACCKGGENQYTLGCNHFEKPRRKNLSCDAHVNRLVQKGCIGMLPLDDRRGVVINPLLMPTTRILLRFDTDQGKLDPHPRRCADTALEGNRYSSTFELVENTIRVFNLNCPRLCRARKEWFDELEDKLEEEKEAGHSAEDVRVAFCEWLLSPPYPSFYKVSRFWLGPIAEAFLRDQGSVLAEP